MNISSSLSSLRTLADDYRPESGQIWPWAAIENTIEFRQKTSVQQWLFLCHSDSKGDGKYLWGSQILCKWPRPGEYFYLFLVWLTYIVKDFNFLHLRTLLLQLTFYLLQTGLILWLKRKVRYGYFWLDSDSKAPHKSQLWTLQHWGIECNF